MLVSIPGFDVVTQWIQARRKGPKFPIWDRIVLLTIASTLLSLAWYVLLGGTPRISGERAAQVAYEPPAAIFMYCLAIWLADTLGDWKNRSVTQRIADAAILVLLFVPFLVPSMLWAS